MIRPHKERRIEQLPPVTLYKPAGIPCCKQDEITLKIDEMEAIRLADIELLDQLAAAERMEISRSTFNRIINAAHQKIAAALWRGQALRVDGGTFRIAHKCQTDLRYFTCQTCGHKWTLPHCTRQRCCEVTCPACQASNVIHKDK